MKMPMFQFKKENVWLWGLTRKFNELFFLKFVRFAEKEGGDFGHFY